MLLNKIYSFLDRNTKGKNIITLFVIGFTLQFIIMGLLLPSFLKLSGGLQPLDLRSWYTPEDSMALIGALGEAGTSFYLWRFLLVDLPFPFIMSIAFASLVNLIIKKIEFKRKYIYIPVFVPMMILLFDYIENLMTTLSIFSFPNIPMGLTYIGAVCTFSKNIFFMLTLLVLVIGTLRLIFLKIRKKRS